MTGQYTEQQIIEALEIRMPHDEVCRESYDLIQQKNAQIEHLTAEIKGLKRFIKDLMKDEVKT
jgi:hypothetical protein